MRGFLEKIYLGAGYLAGAFLIGTLLAVLASILGRLLNINTPGADAYAGYCMAAAAFLALPYTLRHGEHIRVTLFLHHVGAKANRAMEIFCHATAVFLSGSLAWYSMRLVWQSHLFHDVSTGLDATPLWIPQLGMAVGAVLFFVSFIEDFIAWLAGTPVGHTSARDAAPTHIE